jgi:hypothetical protein
MNLKISTLILALFAVAFFACEKEVATNNEPAYYPAPEPFTPNGAAEFTLNGRISTSDVLMSVVEDTLGISSIGTTIFLNGRSLLVLSVQSNPIFMPDSNSRVPVPGTYSVPVTEGYKNENTEFLVETTGAKLATSEASAFIFSDNYCAPLKVIIEQVDTATGIVNISVPYLEFCDEDLQRVIFEDLKISAIN